MRNISHSRFILRPTNMNNACDVCSKTYTWTSGLQRHSKSHKRDKDSHVCPICSKRFTRKDNLSKHLIMFHQTQMNPLETPVRHVKIGSKSVDRKVQRRSEELYGEPSPVETPVRHMNPRTPSLDWNTKYHVDNCMNNYRL